MARMLSMIRSFSNDSYYARLLANDNLADATGEAYHACSSPRDHWQSLPTWYSLPASAMCPVGFALGINNCTWSANYTLVRAITAQCLLSIPDPLFPRGFSLSACTNNSVNVGKHIQFAIDHCPPVSI